MGTHVWYITRTIRCPDGTAVGKLGPHFKGFIPWIGLMLSRYGIYANPDRDAQGEMVGDVWSVHTPEESSPDHFLVHLEDVDRTDESISTALRGYGAGWDWKLYPVGGGPQ